MNSSSDVAWYAEWHSRGTTFGFQVILNEHLAISLCNAVEIGSRITSSTLAVVMFLITTRFTGHDDLECTHRRIILYVYNHRIRQDYRWVPNKLDGQVLPTKPIAGSLLTWVSC